MSSEQPILTKADRVRLILAALTSAPAVSSREAALELMDRIFRGVEDEHSGVPHEPFHAARLYPTVAAMERRLERSPRLRRYRHTAHYTLIADNGAIAIRTVVGDRTILEKPGADGRIIAELE